MYTWIDIGWYESIVSNAHVLSTVGFEFLLITALLQILNLSRVLLFNEFGL